MRALTEGSQRGKSWLFLGMHRITGCAGRPGRRRRGAAARGRGVLISRPTGIVRRYLAVDWCVWRGCTVKLGSGAAFIRSMLNRLLTLRSGTAPISGDRMVISRDVSTTTCSR